jgi:spermidine synthase
VAAAVKRKRVRVQGGPHGRELIVDETFASYYRPGMTTTGSVWDAIAAPLLSLPPGRLRRVLLLGLGGGSVARIVRALAPSAEIVGVELDEDVVKAARDHFALDALDLELVVDDALAFLRRDRRKYDAVLEDIFIGYGDDVHKPDWIPEPGLELAARRLRGGGLLVSNTIDETPRVRRWLRGHFGGGVELEVEDYDNRVLACGPEGLSGRALRAAIAGSPVLASTLPQLRIRSWGTR